MWWCMHGHTDLSNGCMNSLAIAPKPFPTATVTYHRDFNAPLVDVLRRFIEEGRPLEAAFSRARSFSQKLKRKGRFVPRGMVATDYEAQMGSKDREPQPSQ